MHHVPRPASRSSHLLTTLAVLAIACGGDDGSAPVADEGGSGSAGPDTGAMTSGMTAPTSDASATAASVDGGSVDGSGTAADATGNGSDSGSDDGGNGGYACLDAAYVNGGNPGADYSMFDVPVGSHCNGTNQQDITDIERVVFLGDSVTVGTPPTGTGDFYRVILAEALAAKFGIEAPATDWENANALSGMSGVMESGAFASCAHYGDQNGDLMGQLESCFAPEDLTQRTLVIFTMGGNDGASIAKDYLDGAELADVLARIDTMVAAHEQAVQWLVEPGKFENGVFVVNANVYEFTDLTFDFLSCPTAGLAGFSSSAEMPEVLLGGLQQINSEYMRIAQENGTDLVFMSENFCGHGFHADDADDPCYRGPGNETWFDLTCIHPTPAGHAALADMFLDTISE